MGDATEQAMQVKPLFYFLLLFIIAAIGALYWPTLAGVAKICWENDDYSHGVLMPAITLYILYDRKKVVLQALERSFSPVNEGDGTTPLIWGLGLLVIGALIFTVGTAGGLLFVSWFSLFPVISGAILLTIKRPLSTVILPPILLNYMSLPLPGALLPKLFGPFQAFAARCSAWSLEVLNVPVYVVGNVIHIPNMQLLVEEACSGMRSLMAIITVALIVLMLVEMPKWAKAFLVALAVLIAIALNIVRVVATGLLAHFVDPSTAEGFIHTFSGLVTFCLGLAILYSVGKVIQKSTSSGSV